MPTRKAGLLSQHLAVQDKQRAKGLALRRCRNMFMDSQMRQKGLHLHATHLVRVSFTVKQNETLDPTRIALRRSGGVVLALDRLPHLVQ